MIKAKLLQIMTYLIRHFQDETKPVDDLRKKQDKLNRLHLVIEYLQENYNKDIYLRDAAAKAFMNPNYFSTFFKNTMGVSFKEYLLKLRTTKAVQLIKNTDKPILEIALECGFNNISSFYSALKNVKNVEKPSKLRK